MSYREKEVVAKYTQGAMQSDCGEYSVNDLIEMFDCTEITIDELGNTDGVTVNDCVEDNIVLHDLVVTSECDDMFVYYNKETECEIECSAELDEEWYNEFNY